MDNVPNSQACAVENASAVHISLQKTADSRQTFRTPANPLDGPLLNVDDARVLCQGFSIREYVGKVRNVSIRKCWPFSESLLEDNLRDGGNQLLPPLDRPIYRRWASQHSVKADGEHQPHLTSCHKLQRHGAQPENHTTKIDRLMVSLDPISVKDPGISKDLEEQIRKFSSVKISVQDDNIANREGGINRRKSRDESQDDYCHRQGSLVPPLVRAACSTPKRTSQSDSGRDLPRLHKNGKAGTDMHKAPANENQTAKPDTVMHKSSINRRQGHTFTFDSMGNEYKSLIDVGIGEETERAKMARKVAQDQVTAWPIFAQPEKTKIDNLNLQATKSESVRHGICDISDNEVYGLKVCPVCKTFTSATVTAVNAHIDDCLAQASKSQRKQGKMHRQKSRSQKKRSMVAIFAAVPPVEKPLDSPENLAMNESPPFATTDLKDEKPIAQIETCAESAIPDGLPNLNCKRRKTNEARSPASGKAGKGKAESVKPKRKRQRLGMVSSVSNPVQVKKRGLL